MPTARFKFEIPGPDGPFALSTDYPDGKFRIQAAFPKEDGLLVVFEARMSDNSTATRYFDEAQLSYDVLHTDERIVIVQYFVPFPHRFVPPWPPRTCCNIRLLFEMDG